MMQENQKSISLGFPTFYDLEIDRAPPFSQGFFCLLLSFRRINLFQSLNQGLSVKIFLIVSSNPGRSSVMKIRTLWPHVA